MRGVSGKGLMGQAVAVLLTALTLLGAVQLPERGGSAQAATLYLPAWELVACPSAATMYALDMVSASDGWAGGMDGLMFHYADGAWGGVATDFRAAIQAIDMLGPSSGWGGCTQGEFIVWNGSTWTVHSNVVGGVSDLHMLSPSIGWAVGGGPQGGQILRYQSGSNQWALWGTYDRHLKAIDMVSANDGWIVGIGGTFLHWNGAAWAGGSIDPAAGLYDVDMANATDGWAVGANGVMYHYNGSSWSKVVGPASGDLNAVHMLRSDFGWAVGEDGVLLFYDGSTWRLMPSPTTRHLYAVQILSETDGWAVGQFGTILHFNGLVVDLAPSSKRVDRVHAAPGEELTYTIRVVNWSPIEAPSVVVSDPTPAGATFVPDSVSKTKGTIISVDPLVVEVGDMAADEEVTISFKVSVDDDGPECHFVTNEAIIGMPGKQWTRRASTSVGDCQRMFLPVIARE